MPLRQTPRIAPMPGKAVIAFTLAGLDYHPSAAWPPLSLQGGAGPVDLATAGAAADDDFSALRACSCPGSMRRKRAIP